MSAATDHSTDAPPNPSPPHTPSRTGKPAVPSTPAAAALRPALQNHYASFTHGISAQAIKMRTNPNLLTEDPFIYGVADNTEEKISRNAGVATSLKTVGAIKRSDLEGKRYPPTILLLNRISKLYFELSGRTDADAAIVFAYTRGSSPPGAWLGDTVQPDYSAFTSNIDYLRDFARGKNPPAQPWSLLVGVGEHKRENEPLHAQLKTYISTVKRYRPDLATVYGFHVAGDRVEVALLNSCCLCLSPEYKVSSLAPWLALVASIYYSVDNRDTKITYESSQGDFHRWDVRYGAQEEAFAAVPFHAGDAPGRTAFTAFELGPLSTPSPELSEAFYNKPADGFFKMSWQDVKASWHESELLNFLHDKEWLPGLVRPRHVERLENVIVKRQGKLVEAPKRKPKKADDEQPVEEVKQQGPKKRELEIIHLGSIGEPLSQARTLRHALFAAYDLAETSSHMSDLNVLHRDLSWYNCLIFPRHTVHEGKREASRPCIRKILDAAGVTVDSVLDDIGRRDSNHPDGPYEPCGLITDLDHSAKIGGPDGLIARVQAGRKERTGTPMFIACEQAEPGSLRSHKDTLVNLVKILDLVKGKVGGPAALAAAFPNGDGGFMDMIKRVVPAEETRRNDAGLYRTLAPPNPTPVHEPRHDVESLYWVLLWLFARAKPLKNGGFDRNKGTFNAFCETMLNHKLGGDIGEAKRSQYLTAGALGPDFFHPAFAKLQIFFAHMALYLSIPWYLYADDPYFAAPGARNHAHIAFRRLLLWMLLSTDMPELDIPLNTEEPRITPVFDGSVKPSRKSEHRAATGNEMSAHQVEENVAVTVKPPSPEIAGYRLRGQQGRDRHRKGSSIAPAKGTRRAPSKKHAKSTSHTSTSSRKRARDETDADSDSHDDDSQDDDDDDDDDAPARKKRAVLVSGDDTDSTDDDDLPAPASVEEPMVLDPTTPTDSSSSVDEPAASVDESTASANAVTATDEAKGVKQRPLDPKIQQYVAKIHAGQQTVNALRLKIWKDKTLWFGRGD